MKKVISAISVVMLLIASAVSCQKETSNERQAAIEATHYTFAISVNGEPGFNATATKAVKTNWENGDRIYLFFKPSQQNLLNDTYATMVYNGTSWTTTMTGKSSLTTGGHLSAVYVPYIGSVVPQIENGKWTIGCGDVYYSCAAAQEYKVESSTVKATLKMVIPNDYVQFYITDVTASDILTCNNVDSFKDIIIDGNLAVASKTKTSDGTMTGRKFNASDNGIVFYGRLKSTLPADCQLSVTKEKITYRRFIQNKKLEHKAYNLGEISTNWTPILLPGEFSVGQGKTVRFSHSNLCWTGNVFEFEKDQFSYPASWDSQHVGHFYWTQKGNEAYAVEITPSSSATDMLFTNTDEFTVYGQTGWYTLSIDEWKYLLQTRTDAPKKYDIVKVDGKQGLVIVPDNFSGEISKEYTTDQWAAAEKQNGFVFLPFANTRTKTTIDIQNAGQYWSSTNGGEAAYYFSFVVPEAESPIIDDDSFTFKNKDIGLSIRLVKVVKSN